MRSIHLRLTVVVVAMSLIHAACAQETLISPEELLDRMWQNGQYRADTGYGKYISKIYNAPQPSEAQAPSQIDETVKQIIANAEKREPEQREKVLSQIPDIRKALEVQSTRTSWTSCEVYNVSGNKYRIDRWMLPEGQSLDAMRQSDWNLDAKADFVTAWNGQWASQLDRVTLKETKREADSMTERLLLSSAPPKPPGFLSFGREVPDKNLLGAFRQQGLPITVESAVRQDGEEALLLRVGEKGTVGFSLEAVVLPNKGYSIAESEVTMYGAPQVREEYSDFIQTAAGFWVPMKIKREAYKLSKQGVPELSSRQEMIALEQPRVNVPVDDEVFDLIPTADTTIVIDQRAGKDLSYVVPGRDSKLYQQLLSPDGVATPLSAETMDKRPMPALASPSAANIHLAAGNSLPSGHTNKGAPGTEQPRGSRFRSAVRYIMVGSFVALGTLFGFWLFGRGRNTRHGANTK
jgi:hypothetical protein